MADLPGMSETVSIHKTRVLNLARRMRAPDRESALGRCLVLSLQLAEAAQVAQCTDLQLVRWRVLDDDQFRDHWAVWLDPETVVDLTRIQVDGRCQVLGPASGYPPNYVEPRRYPARLLLQGHCSSAASAKHGVMRRRYLLALAWRMLEHDARAARAQRAGSLAWAACSEYGNFVWWLTLRDLKNGLRDRAMTLTRRLENQPEYAARDAPAAEAAAATDRALADGWADSRIENRAARRRR